MIVFLVLFYFVSSGSEIPENLCHILADTTKPTLVLDPVTNEEILLGELSGCDPGGLSELCRKCLD